MSLGFYLPGHLTQIAGGRLLEVSLGDLNASQQFECVFYIQKYLNVPMPIVGSLNGLQECLVKTHRRRLHPH